MKNRLLPILLFLLSCCALGAPSLEQRLIPEGEPLPFGNTMELVLTYTYPAEASPPNADTLELPGAHIVDRYSVDGPHGGTTRSTIYHIVFTRFEPGEFEIPAISVGSTKSKPVTIEFAGSTPIDSDKPGEIRAPKSVMELSTADFWKKVVLIALGALLLTLLVNWLFQRFGILDRWRSPKGRAVKRLQRLRASDPGPQGLLLGSVEILRNYLNEAYGLVTAQSTSREILNQMIMDNRCRELKDSVTEVLQQGDAVKFAQLQPAVGEVEDHYQNLLKTLQSEPKVKA